MKNKNNYTRVLISIDKDKYEFYIEHLKNELSDFNKRVRFLINDDIRKIKNKPA